MSIRFLFICISFILVSTTTLFSQNKGWHFGGAIAVGGFHYYQNSNQFGLKPFGASLSANARISYGQFSIPIGIVINNQGSSFQNPFSRYGISPQYKWVKAHLGWRRMNFSEFTMKGMQFLGVGLELTPGIFRMSVMHGKLDYRIAGLPLDISSQLPTRKVTALKIGIGNNRRFVDLVFMKGKDNEQESILNLKTKENLAVGLDFRMPILKNRVVFFGKSGVSLLTEDQDVGNEFLQNTKVPNILTKVIEPNNSSHVNYAFATGINFNFGPVTIQNTYRRVMPEYQSMGINYLRNDQEAIFVDVGLKLLKNKVIVKGTIGKERNNLDQLRNLDQARIISSANVNIRPNSFHNINLQYANYSFDQTIKFDSLITNDLVIQQVNTNIGGTYIYANVVEGRSHIISFTNNYQEAVNVNDNRLNSNTFAALANYSTSQLKSNNSFNYGLNFFQTTFTENVIQQVGISGGYSHKKDKRLFSVKGGTMISLGDQLLNIHMSLRYRIPLAERVGLELSSRLRYNQRATLDNTIMARSDVRFLMQL